MVNHENTFNKKSSMAWIFSILLLFLLNDFVNMQTSTYPQWLVADYAYRMIVIAVIVAHEPFRRAVTDSVRLPVAVWKVSMVALLMTAMVVALFIFIERPMFQKFPETVFFLNPRPTSSLLHAIDLTFGLALVAASEEFLFRVLIPRFLSNFYDSKVFVLFGSSLLFGLVHWSQGIGLVLAASLSGMVWIYSVQRTGSIRPTLLSHYLANLLFFW